MRRSPWGYFGGPSSVALISVALISMGAPTPPRRDFAGRNRRAAASPHRAGQRPQRAGYSSTVCANQPGYDGNTPLQGGSDMNKQFVMGVAFSVLVGSFAKAADIAIAASPPLVSPYTWTGWYIGLNVGYHFNNANDIDTASTNAFAFPGAGGPSLAAASPALSNFSAPGGKNGVTGGLQGGYNWQFTESWLVGIEADNEGVSKKGTSGSVSTVPVAGTLNVLRQGDSISEQHRLPRHRACSLGISFHPHSAAIWNRRPRLRRRQRGDRHHANSPRHDRRFSDGMVRAPVNMRTRVSVGRPAPASSGCSSHAGPPSTVLHYDLGTASYNVNPLVSNAPPFAKPFTTVNTLHSTASFSGNGFLHGVNYKF